MNSLRLHSDSETEKTSREDVLSILQVGARYSMHQLVQASDEELKALLVQFERYWESYNLDMA